MDVLHRTKSPFRLFQVREFYLLTNMWCSFLTHFVKYVIRSVKQRNGLSEKFSCWQSSLSLTKDGYWILQNKQFLAITTFNIKLFDPDCIEIGLIVNVAPGAPGSGERRKEICLIQTGKRVALFSEFAVWLQSNVI